MTQDNIDIYELLTRRRQVAVIWSIADVKSIRPDLGDDHAWEVLRECERSSSCDIGLSWEFIEEIAERLFPLANDDDSIGGSND